MLAFLLGTAVTAVQPAAQSTHKATLKTASAASPDIPFREYEFQAEQDLLELANQARKQSGAGPLTLDSGLTDAARVHAQAMLDARKLSHQFDGEPTLPQRLAATTSLLLDQEGENVALDYSANAGHEHLMLSPPHRANLLNPAYNVVGLGVVRRGDRLYVVQDFGHALPRYSIDEAKDRASAAVNRMRHESHRPALSRRDLTNADEAACSMAQADKLGTSPVRKLAEQYTVLTYTSLHPETLPRDATRAIASPNLHSVSIGACYARTDTYPTGVYWLVLTLD